jgi:hypothetical protein
MRAPSKAFTSKERKTGIMMTGLFLAALAIGCDDSSGPVDRDQSPTEPGAGTGAGPGGAGPAPLVLGTAGNFVILTKAGISSQGASAITGDIGVSPGLSTSIAGFDFTREDDSVFATSALVTGNVFAADFPDPTPANLVGATDTLDAAFIDIAARHTPDHENLADGEIGGMTLPPGLYRWTTNVNIDRDITLQGGPNDTWIFQILGSLTVEPNARVSLTGGALARNVYWNVGGDVNLGAEAHLEGIVLAHGTITIGTGATVNGRLFSNSRVALNTATVIAPQAITIP